MGWADSRRAFSDAAAWFVHMSGLVDDRWSRPGLGEWDVRSLVGHTSRALLTVESYLVRPAASVEVDSAVGYFRAAGALAAASEVAARGREAGAALGPDPAAAVAEVAARVVPLVEACDGTELVTTIVGGMRLSDYLTTRTFELVVHTADISAALGVPPHVPDTSASEALHLAAELAVTRGLAAPLLLAATGRQDLPRGFTLL